MILWQLLPSIFIPDSRPQPGPLPLVPSLNPPCPQRDGQRDGQRTGDFPTPGIQQQIVGAAGAAGTVGANFPQAGRQECPPDRPQVDTRSSGRFFAIDTCRKWLRRPQTGRPSRNTLYAPIPPRLPRSATSQSNSNRFTSLSTRFLGPTMLSASNGRSAAGISASSWRYSS
jgi:hypothetical protein